MTHIQKQWKCRNAAFLQWCYQQSTPETELYANLSTDESAATYRHYDLLPTNDRTNNYFIRLLFLQFLLVESSSFISRVFGSLYYLLAASYISYSICYRNLSHWIEVYGIWIVVHGLWIGVPGLWIEVHAIYSREFTNHSPPMTCELRTDIRIHLSI